LFVIVSEDKAERARWGGISTIDKGIENVFTVSVDQIVDVSENSTIEMKSVRQGQSGVCVCVVCFTTCL
jgi:hypothetical protein